MRPDGPRDDFAGPDEGPAPPFPLRLDGKVIKGFGRGSSELGIPTANIPLSGLSVGGKEDIESGIYFGWAGLSPSAATASTPTPDVQGSTGAPYTLMQPEIYNDLLAAIRTSRPAKKGEGEDEGQVYPMVMSIGWNPFYKNSVRSCEVHIMAPFTSNFYDSHMNLVVLGFIRPEYDYVSMEALVEDIKTDIDVAGRSLARKGYVGFSAEKSLTDFGGKSEVAS